MSFYDIDHNEGNRQNENYPVELPSRNSKKEISPIVDVTEHEVYPLEFTNCHRTKPHFDTNGDITEIVTTETEAETEERTTHEQHKWGHTKVLCRSLLLRHFLLYRVANRLSSL